MSILKMTIAPEYLCFYVAGSRDVDIPMNTDRRGLFANRDCISIPALYWNDGDTSVLLASEAEIARTGRPDFDGFIRTPQGVLILFDANVDEIASVPVESVETRVRIWINHPTEPNEVVISWRN